MADQPLTRDRLVQAASELLWERSYYAVGVDEVCRRANARKGSFYHFFASKSELAVAAMEARWQYVRRHVFEPISENGAPGLDRLRRLVEVLAAEQGRSVRFFQVVLGSPFGNVAQETSHQDERLRKAFQAIYGEQVAFIVRWLEEAEGGGEILIGDNRQRAQNVLALLEGALLLAKIEDKADTFQAIAASVPVIASAL